MDFQKRVAGAVDRIMRKHKKNLLTNLVIDEISIVDHPANPGAQAVLFKHDTVTDSPIVKLAKRRRAEAAGDYSDEYEIAKASQSPLVRLAADKRRRARGKAMPDGTFPIEDAADLGQAIRAIGRAKDGDKAKAHIIRRARALGLTDLLPYGWVSKGYGA